MLALLTSLARALAAFLEIRAITARYDLQRRIEADIAADESEIALLRARGDDAGQLRADLLRQRILRAAGIAANLPAAGAPPGGGSARADA